MERNTNLDILKFISCFFVIYIHSFVKPSMNFGAEYIKVLSRVAVPFFLMISGYYYPVLQERGKQGKQLRRLLIITAIASLFYFCFSFQTISFTFSNIIDWIVFNADPLSMHLWYLYAFIYVLLVVSLFGDKLLKHAAKISFFLILINYFLSFGSNFCLYRNFLFTGLPYFLLGFSIQKEQARISNFSLFRYKWTISFLLMILLWIEFYVYKELGLNTNRDHFFMIYPLSLFVFCCAVLSPNRSHGWIAYIGQHYSTGIYIFHIFLISVISYVVNNFIGTEVLNSIENNYIYPVILMVVSIAFVCFYKSVWNYCKRKAIKLLFCNIKPNE